MSSVSQFRNCPKCGGQIHVSKKDCPQCGHKNRKLRWFHWLFIIIGGLIVLGAIGGGGTKSSQAETDKPATKQTTRKPETAIPAPQREFIETVSSYVDDFRGAKNELQQSSTRVKRRQALAGLGLGMRINDWVGTIKGMDTTSEGYATLTVAIGSGIELCTHNNGFSDMGAGTLIGPESDLYEVLSDMAKGQKVKFSGSFFPSDDDYYEEQSVTIKGSMTEPEFLFKFTTIGQPD